MKLYIVMLGIAVILLILIPSWIFIFAPQFLKLDHDFQGHYDFIHHDNLRTIIGEDWEGETLINANLNEKTISYNNKEQVISSRFQAESLSGEVLWEVNKNFTVYRKDKSVIKVSDSDENQGFYYFPPDLKRKKYKVWIPEFFFIWELNYVGEEKINGLKVFQFSNKNIISDDTKGFSYLELVPEEYYAFSNQELKIWVEPVTGIVVDFFSDGTSYYVDKVTNEKIWEFEKWGNKFNKDTISNQINIAQNEKQKIILIEKIIPILLGLIIIALLIASYFGEKYYKKEGRK